MGERRGRPTIRCLVDDLGIDLPGLDVDLSEVDHPLLEELRRVAPTSPKGQKRILSIDYPLVFRIRVSSGRGATWVDEQRGIVWLCAAHRRDADSDDDAYAYFLALHDAGNLLPDDDDRLRDRAEAAVRLQHVLTTHLLDLVDQAFSETGVEHRGELADWLPCRLLVLAGEGVEEVWCALSVRGTDGAFVPEPMRDLLFVALERHIDPAELEARNDWPSGDVEWFEVVVLGLR